jgi:hypothetical protein
MCLAWPVTKTMAFSCTEANLNLGILIVVSHFLGFGPPSSILCAKKLNAVLQDLCLQLRRSYLLQVQNFLL